MKKHLFDFHENREETGENSTYQTEQNMGSEQWDFRSMDQQENRKKKHGKKGFRTVAAVAGLAVLFGGVAGAAFYGVNAVTEGMGSAAKQIASADTVSLTQVSTESSDTALTDLVKASMPFVVSIQNMTVEEVQNFFGGTSQQESTSVGTGIIIGENENELLIVTNAHVVEGADTLTVTFDDQTSVEANIKGSDSDKDLAVVAVSLENISSDTKSEIKTAVLGDSDALQVGEEVVAIGNALGYGQSVTNGIVSAKDREISGYDGTLIQTNTAINPGNSGGALINMQGEVVGINCAKISDSSVEGMGYAIPVSEVSDIIQNLMNQATKTKVSEEERGSLGIQVLNIDEATAERYGMPEGIYISGKTQENADSDLQKGYIITAINGTKVTDTTSLQKELSYYKAGEEVTLTVQYAGENGEYTEKDIAVTLVSGQSAEQ